MKLYTQILNEIKEVEIIEEKGCVVCVKAYDLMKGEVRAMRNKAEIFKTKTEAKNYFK